LASSFRWDTSKFENPKHMEKQLLRAVFATVKYWDGPIEAWMKHNAPWNDRTTNARNGLFAKAQREADKLFSIVLGHIVDYGVYLEDGTENMRARPIIRPAMDLFGPKVVNTLVRILDRLG